jgi:carboxymethylenebutenolidase
VADLNGHSVEPPTPTLDLTPGITGRILYLVGEADHIIGPAEQDAIRDALRDAGVDNELVAYPGVDHAFFWPGTPARNDAWDRILALLAR